MQIDQNITPSEKSFSKILDTSFTLFVKDVYLLIPKTFYEKWRDGLNEIESTYKRMVLENTKARSGIFLGQWKGTSIDDFIKNNLNFEVHRESGKVNNPSYNVDKYMKVCGFASVIHLRKYKRITDYAIKFIMMRVFLSYFDRYYVYVDSHDNKKKKGLAYIGEKDFDITYNYLINANEHDLPGFDYKLDVLLLMRRNRKKYGIRKNTRPKMPNTLDELTFCLTGEEYGKMEQYEVISKYFGITERCARKWMKILEKRKEESRKEESRKNDFKHSWLFDEFDKEIESKNATGTKPSEN